HSAGDISDGAEPFQLVSGLQGQNQTDKKGYQGKDRQSANTRLHRLRHGALQTQRLATEWRHKCIGRGAEAELGEPAQVSEGVDAPWAIWCETTNHPRRFLRSPSHTEC